MNKDKASNRVVHRTVGNNKWFPGSKNQLEAMIKMFLDKAKPPKTKGRIVGAIAPHAGYIYSGPTAGWTFRAIRDNAAAGHKPETVVVLGFSHGGSYPGVALMDGDAIESPIATTSLDTEAARMLTGAGKLIYFDYTPHAWEHSAENEIPFVQAALPDAKLVVGIIGDHEEETLAELVKGLTGLAAKKRILVVASTDMLHDPDYELVASTDKATLDLVAAMDYRAVLKRWSPRRQIFCGIQTVQSAMRFAEAQGCKKGEVLYYRNSGDDYPEGRGSWVVGYGAVVFAVDEK